MRTGTRDEGRDATSSPGEITPILLRSLLLQIIIVPLALTAFLAVLFLLLTIALLNVSGRLDQADRIIDQSRHLQTMVLDVEAGLRGSLIAGRADPLQPYANALGSIDQALDKLAELTARAPSHSKRSDRLRALANEWRHRSEVAVDRGQAEPGARQPARLSDEDDRLLRELRAVLSGCIADEEILRDRERRSTRTLSIIALVSTAFTALAVGTGLCLITRKKLASVSTLYEDALGTARERSDALLRSEARFQAFMEHTPAVAFVKDELGRYLYGNRAWVALFSAPIETLLGRTDRELRDEETAREFVASDQQVRELSAPIEIAATTRDTDGQTREWITLKFPLDDGSGQRLIGGISVDVTELRRAEQGLRASEERYTLAMRGSSAGLWDWTCDNDDLYLSPRFKELIGFDDHEVENTLETFVSLIHPEDRERVMFSFSEHLTRQVPYDVEHRLQTKHGGYRWFNARGQAIWNECGKATRMSGSITDINDRKLAEAENLALNARLERRLQRLSSMRMVDAAITAGLDLPIILSLVLDQVKAQLRVDACNLLLLDPESRMLATSAHWGFRTEALRNVQTPISRLSGGWFAAKPRSLHIADLAQTDLELSRAGDFAREGFVSYHAAPLLAKGETKGILEVFHRSPFQANQEWIDFLEILAGQAAIAIENVNLYEGLRRANTELTLAYDATIEGWSHAMDLRDKETEGHCRRVTETTVRLAHAMGIGTEEVIQIRRGALLHDIGKMGIPDRILLKPGPLNEDEWQVMRKHPEYAREMLSQIDFLRPAIDIPYCHHEKWDGSGYPQGLVGEEIPLAARIFAVADIWDALSNDRPYRKAWPQGRVVEHIESLAGSALDPVVVETFLRLIATRGPTELEPTPKRLQHPFASPTETRLGVGGDLPVIVPPSPSPFRLIEAPAPIKLTVLVADPHPPTTDVLKAWLTEMGHEVLVVADGREAWQTVQLGHIQVLIVDWNLPGIGGPELCRRIRKATGLVSTYIILTGERNVPGRAELPTNVDDFLAKPIDRRELTTRLAVAQRLLTAELQLHDRTAQAKRMYIELRDQNERLTELVATDPLTGLSNRRHLLEVLEAQSAQVQRQEQPLSLAIIDVDRFKQFNDVYGHRAGDEVLCRIADILRRNVRGCDLVARYGGEEFVVVMPTTPVAQSREIAERLRTAIADAAWSLRPITSSFGVTTTTETTLDLSRLVDRADQALYRSKQRGRNRVTHSSELDNELAPQQQPPTPPEPDLQRLSFVSTPSGK